MRVTDKEIKPRDGHMLRVGMVARISGCTNHRELSVEDQIVHVKQAVREHYDDAIDFEVTANTKAGHTTLPSRSNLGESAR